MRGGGDCQQDAPVQRVRARPAVGTGVLSARRPQRRTGDMGSDRDGTREPTAVCSGDRAGGLVHARNVAGLGGGRRCGGGALGAPGQADLRAFPWDFDSGSGGCLPLPSQRWSPSGLFPAWMARGSPPPRAPPPDPHVGSPLRAPVPGPLASLSKPCSGYLHIFLKVSWIWLFFLS